MRKKIYVSILITLAFLFSTTNGFTQTFNGNTVNTAGNSTIPSTGTGGCTVAPQTTGGTIFNNTVSGIAGSAILTQVLVNFTHTFDSDIDMYLYAPNGQIIELSTDNGGGGDNYTNTIFDDAAAISITAGAPPFTGTFRPEGTLTASACGTTITPTVTTLGGFSTGQNGTWQLVIKDDVGADVGTMLNWSLTFFAPLAPCAPGAPITFTNNTPVAITDNTTVTSTITVSGAPTYLYDLNLTTFITHTFAGDLDITLTSPAGTVVTITTDNGGGNDDVFNGTVWDDNAGASNAPGPVTDNTFADLVVETPLAPEGALAAFIGENPNGIWTISISDDAGGDVGSLNSWSLNIVGFPTAPTTATTSASNNTPVAITDNTTVTSTITVSGAGTQILDVNMITNILHTFAGDLDITLTSPAGTIVTITTDNGGGNDDVFNGTVWDDYAGTTNPPGPVTDNTFANLVVETPLIPEEAMGAFIGEDPNGVWTLSITDDAGGDVGTLTSWSLDIVTSLCSISCTLTCPANIVVSNDPDQCGAVVNYPAPTSSGACGSTITTMPPSGSFFPVGITTVTATSDAGGGFCTFTIRVNDTQAPVLGPCPANIVASNSPGQCGANVSFTLPSATDNCPGVTVTSTPTSGSFFPTGTTTVTVSATDASGNTATCTFTVTVSDTQPPTITCPANITVPNAPNQCSATVNYSLPTVTDNCPLNTVLLQNFDGVTAPALPSGWTTTTSGAAGVLWVTSNAGNPAPSSFSSPNAAFVPDNSNIGDNRLETPVIPIVAVPAQLSFRNNYDMENNFDGGVLEISIAGGAFQDILAAGGTFVSGGYNGTISTAFGNPIAGRQAWTNVSGGFINTVVNLPAAVAGQNIQLRFRQGTDNSVADVGWRIDNVLISEGVLPVLVSGIASGGTFPVGTTTNVYRATDASGNTSTCSFTVTVNDTQAPAITCPANITQATPIGSCTAVVNYSVTAADNCPGVTTALVSGPASGSAFPLGTTTVRWRATDASGNTSTCQFTVTVTDAQIPVISVQPADVEACVGSNAVFTVTAAPLGGPNNLTYQWEVWNPATSTWVAIGSTSANPNLTVPNVTMAMAGTTYRVRVIGLCTTITSGMASLRVKALPTVSLSTSRDPALTPGQLVNITASVSVNGGTIQWYKNGVPMTVGSVFSLMNLSVDDAGTYHVVYTAPNGCSATSNNIIVSKASSSDVFVYPNPSNGQFQVRVYQPNTQITITVYDGKGAMVYQRSESTGTVPYTRIDVNMTAMAAGQYVVEVRDSGGNKIGVQQIVVWR